VKSVASHICLWTCLPPGRAPAKPPIKIERARTTDLRLGPGPGRALAAPDRACAQTRVRPLSDSDSDSPLQPGSSRLPSSPFPPTTPCLGGPVSSAPPRGQPLSCTPPTLAHWMMAVSSCVGRDGGDGLPGDQWARPAYCLLRSCARRCLVPSSESPARPLQPLAGPSSSRQPPPRSTSSAPPSSPCICIYISSEAVPCHLFWQPTTTRTTPTCSSLPIYPCPPPLLILLFWSFPSATASGMSPNSQSNPQQRPLANRSPS
jgi:hypothetical protein